MFGKRDSGTCLAEGTCDPLGGHSVLAFSPPLQPSESSVLPLTVVSAQTDGLGLFHDDITGADAPLSGLVAVLAAADILRDGQPSPKPRRGILYAFFAGEPWGYMGSKRFLWELSEGSSSMQGFSLSNIDQVIELGQIGRAANNSDGRPQLYFHSQRGTEFGDSRALWDSLSSSKTARISRASESTPGIPPSSLASFLRANASIAGAVLTEFDTHFLNLGYATASDTREGIQEGAIVAAAAATARALFKLTHGNIKAFHVDSEKLRTTVRDLIECLATKGALLSCRLAQDLITRIGMPSNYVGVLHTLTTDPQDPDVYIKSDISRFIWNFMAERTSIGPAKLASGKEGGCIPGKNPCQAGAVCVGYRIDKPSPKDEGRCLFATTRFAPSYSTSIQCKDCSAKNWGKWTPSSQSQSWETKLRWPEDPVWTESRWNEGTPHMQLFLKEAAATETKILVAGILVTLLAVLLTWGAKVLHLRRLKQM